MVLNKPRNFTCIAACFAAAALLYAAPIHGRQVKCRVWNVTVDAVSARDAAEACLGAGNAIRFLASQGMRAPANVTIKVITTIPHRLAESALGAYMKAEKTVLVLSYIAFKERSSSFKFPLDRPLYRAVISHEVAHAIAADNFKQKPSYLGQEYIAYVTLFSTMAPAQRNEILRHYPPDDHWQVHASFLYFFDSFRFGAQAYRHFVKQENGQVFIRKVLDGEVLGEPE